MLVKSISRFARNTVDLLNIVRHLKDIGVEVWFEDEGIHSMDGDGELMLTILASFAQEESRSISENCKWGIRKQYERGASRGCKIYGYRTKKGQLVIREDEAAVVRRIFQMFLDGDSCYVSGKAAGCKTPHVTEEEVKAAFVLVVNKLIGNQATLLVDLRKIQQTYSGTDDLSQSLHELDDRMNAEAEAVQGLIAQNARVALNQDDYNAAYDAAVSRYEATKAEREKVAADIRQRGIRRREFERFITELEKLPEAVSEFDETLWGSLVEYVTVGKDKTMVFTLIGGTEVKA